MTLTLGGHAHPDHLAQLRDRPLPRVRPPRHATATPPAGMPRSSREGDTFVVVDLGSTNGTELNGRRITREELTDGDRITIGATDLVFGRTRP